MNEQEFSKAFLNHMSQQGLSVLAEIYVKEGKIKENSAAEICLQGALTIVDAVEFVTRLYYQGHISAKTAIESIPGILGDYMDYGTDELNEAIDTHEQKSETCSEE